METPAAPGLTPGPSPTLRRAVLGLILAGAALRIAIALLSSRVAPVSDMAWYLEASRAIASGAGLPATVDRPLLYPVFLAALARAGLGSLTALYLVQAALTLAAVAAIGACAGRIAGPRAGWIAAGLFAPQLTIAQYSGLLLSESLFLTLFATWLALVWPRGAEDGATRRLAARLAAAGIAAGIAGALRPAALPLALGTCGALVLAGASRLPDRFVRAGIFAAAAVASLAASVALASRIAGVPAALAPTAGVNLYLGNGPGGRIDGGGVERLPPSLEAIPDPAARNAEAGRQALREMARRPLFTASNVAVRLVRLASLNPGRIEHDALVADGFPSRIAIGWLALEWVLLAALAAVALRSGAVPAGAPSFAAWIALPYVLVLALTYVQTRYRLPLAALLAPFAALGLEALVRASRGRGGLRRLAPAGLLAVSLVLAASAVELLLKTR